MRACVRERRREWKRAQKYCRRSTRLFCSVDLPSSWDRWESTGISWIFWQCSCIALSVLFCSCSTVLFTFSIALYAVIEGSTSKQVHICSGVIACVLQCLKRRTEKDGVWLKVITKSQATADACCCYHSQSGQMCCDCGLPVRIARFEKRKKQLWRNCFGYICRNGNLDDLNVWFHKNRVHVEWPHVHTDETERKDTRAFGVDFRVKQKATPMPLELLAWE